MPRSEVKYFSLFSSESSAVFERRANTDENLTYYCLASQQGVAGIGVMR